MSSSPEATEQIQVVAQPRPPRRLALALQGVGKRYRMPTAPRPRFLTDALLARLAGNGPPSRQDFWALQDVSFEVEQGEVLALVGRNGAGKSTLLKLLSRITPPTTGRLRLYGRVGSLLEVGTGFHPELTGRENIYLNGTILGMSRADITRQFDSIVAFCGYSEFLDVPVKRYSSGMYVRLAFSVAAHLQSDILLVDEVLSVGDAEFQLRCLEKIKSVARSGRTVVVVSHNASSLRDMCRRGILLKDGRLIFEGPLEACLQTYGGLQHPVLKDEWIRSEPPPAPLGFTRVQTRVHGAQPAHELELLLDMESTGPHDPAALHLGIAVPGNQFCHIPLPETFIDPRHRQHHVRLRVALPPLIPGAYMVNLWLGLPGGIEFDRGNGELGFRIDDAPMAGPVDAYRSEQGVVVPQTVVEYEPR